jgi:hypothetical protein
MLPAFLWSVLTHHEGSADPRLLAWIKLRLDQLVDVGPWTVVGVLGLVLVALPLALVAFYLTQRRRIPPELKDAPGDFHP